MFRKDTGKIVIPKILHRSIPRITTPLMDHCWESVKINTPSWEHMTHYDDDQYDFVGEYLDLCPNGAFRADLIRLEVIYKYGGIYLDSDVELFRPIDRLLNNKIFVAEDNEYYLMNAIFGAEPKNNIIFNALQESIKIVKSGYLMKNSFIEDPKHTEGFSAFGPYIFEKYLRDPEVNILLSKEFDTYTQEKRTNEDILRMKEDQDIYGKHWYAGSWLPKEGFVWIKNE